MKAKYMKPRITVAAIGLAYGVMEDQISTGGDYTGGEEVYSKKGDSFSWDLDEEEAEQ